MRETRRDHGYAWVVLGAAYISNVLVGSVMMSSAVYMIDWSEHFNTTKAQVGLTGSILSSVCCFTGLFMSPVINRIGCRYAMMIGTCIITVGMIGTAFATSVIWLYITYGVITGVGLGMVFLPPIVIVQYYFDKRRGLASGISLAGHSSGTFLLLPLLRVLIQMYGWRSTVILHLGMGLHFLVTASLFRAPYIPELHAVKEAQIDSNDVVKLDDPANQQINKVTTSKYFCSGVTNFFKNNWDFTLLKHSMFSRFLLGILLSQFTNETMYKFTPLKAVSEGISKFDAAFLPSVIGLSSTTGRVIISLIADLKCVNRTVICGVAVIFMGLAAFLSCFAWNFYTYIVSGAIFGLALGSQMTLVTTVTVDLIGLKKVIHGTSLFMGSMGMAMVISLFLAGYLADNYNYDVPYFLYGSFSIMGGMLLLSIPITQCINSKTHEISRSEKENDVEKMTSIKEEDIKDIQIMKLKQNDLIYVSMQSLNSVTAI